MQLYATGCNAWSQLDFSGDTVEKGQDDLSRFTMVMSGNVMEKPVSRLTHTIVTVDGRQRVAGFMDDQDLVSQASSQVMAANGSSLGREPAGKTHLVLSKRGPQGQARSQLCFVERPVTQMVAFDTGFAILYNDGTVATMGDARFSATLGRTVDVDEPADQFIRVHDLNPLDDDPVLHITACGYTVAALTESGSVYIWGRTPPSRSQEPSFIPDLSPFPNYVEIGQDLDIKDFALGEAHAIALTTDGDIYVTGSNENGQLGLDIKETRTWVKHDFVAPGDHVISGVSAGPRTSFILTSTKPPAQ